MQNIFFNIPLTGGEYGDFIPLLQDIFHTSTSFQSRNKRSPKRFQSFKLPRPRPRPSPPRANTIPYSIFDTPRIAGKFTPRGSTVDLRSIKVKPTSTHTNKNFLALPKGSNGKKSKTVTSPGLRRAKSTSSIPDSNRKQILQNDLAQMNSVISKLKTNKNKLSGPHHKVTKFFGNQGDKYLAFKARHPIGGALTGWMANTVASTFIFVGASAAIDAISRSNTNTELTEEVANLTSQLIRARSRSEMALEVVSEAVQSGRVPKDIVKAALTPAYELEESLKEGGPQGLEFEAEGMDTSTFRPRKPIRIDDDASPDDSLTMADSGTGSDEAVLMSEGRDDLHLPLPEPWEGHRILYDKFGRHIYDKNWQPPTFMQNVDSYLYMLALLRSYFITRSNNSTSPPSVGCQRMALRASLSSPPGWMIISQSLSP